jgi:hypothetical protein
MALRFVQQYLGQSAHEARPAEAVLAAAGDEPVPTLATPADTARTMACSPLASGSSRCCPA